MIKTIGKHAGQAVREAVLEAGPHRVCILNVGCIVRQWQFQLPNDLRDLVLGFDDFSAYPEHSRCFGIIAGRVANRTCQGQFELSGQHYQLSRNNGQHHLHGGEVGLGGRVWQMESDTNANTVRLTYHSPDGEEGYPGAVDFQVDFTLNAEQLVCDMRGRPDCATPINLAQHNYYNLDSAGDVLGHTLQIAADRYLPVNDELIPTGALESVDQSRFDFRRPIVLGDADPLRQGYDHCMVLSDTRDRQAPAAILASSDQQLELRVITDEPGLQLFTAPALEVAVPGLGGRHYGNFAGICLEAQHLPDSLNRATFPSIVCTPEQPYRQLLKLNVQHCS